MNTSFHNLQLGINEKFRLYDKTISTILWGESPNYDKAIEHAIAMIPNLLFDIYNVIYPFEECEKKAVDCRKFFCFCINYSSSLYPNNRFHLHLNQDQENKEIELKTFCFKHTTIKKIENIIKAGNYADCYDIDSPFVPLLDLFYNHLGNAKNDFSMNRFFADKCIDDGAYLKSRMNPKPLNKRSSNNQIIKKEWYWCIHQKYFGFLNNNTNNKKQNRILDLFRTFLKNETYAHSSENDNHDYTNYAAFLAAASLQDISGIEFKNNYKGYTDWKKGNTAFDSYAKLYKGHSFCQYNIPIFGFQEDHSKQKHSRKVIGNLMVPSLIEIDESVLSVFYEKTDYFLNKILQFEKAIIANRNAVRSAIAQVMARNLSHNYGSHVLNHLLQASLGTFSLKSGPYQSQFKKTGLEELEEKKKENAELYHQIIYLINQLEDNQEAIEAFKEIKINKDERENVDYKDWVEQLKNVVSVFEKTGAEQLFNETLRQIVYFLTHLKCRVDYISDISFGAPILQTTRNVYGDIFKELDRVRLLMNHISGLEEQFQYKIEIKGPNGESLQNKDLQVAVPNDAVGTHAFYNILENIIRNTAKHSNRPTGNGIVTFHVDFSDIIMHNRAPKTLYEAQQYYCVEIYDDIPMDKNKAKELVEKQNNTLNSPIFKDNGPRNHSLGLVEMEASAAYLRKLDSHVVDDDIYEVNNMCEYCNQYGKFHLLKAIIHKEEGNYYFGYRFFMLRPQEVLIVSDNSKQEWHQPSKGVWTITTKDFNDDLGKGKVFNHEFVVYENDDIGQFIQKHKMAVSPRVLKTDLEGWRSSTPSSETIIKTCWQQWMEENTAKQKKESKDWKYLHIKGTYSPSRINTAVYISHLFDHFSFENAEYCEALSSDAQNKLPCFRESLSKYIPKIAKNDSIKERIRNLESINNRILIVDERIQDAAYKQSVYGYLLMEHYKKMGIIVPEMPIEKEKDGVKYDESNVPEPEHENEKDADENKFNLLEKDFSLVAEKIKKYIDNNCKSFDFVLIHYGILERIFKAKTATSNKEWKELLDKYLEKWSQKGPRIILTSGRGVPGKLPSCVGFVSLSSVTAALIDYKSKYLFNCLMYAARKTA